MNAPSEISYAVTGGPLGLPILGELLEATRDPLGLLMRNALHYGDLIPFRIAGQKVLQLNHPTAIRHVLMDNHKNYRKSDSYIRFESAIGQGLLTSNGEKWKRDRQKIQPMFKRELIEGYYFEVIRHVSEKYKRRWFTLTQNGPARIDITREMAAMTTEIILSVIFGKDNLDEKMINALHHSYNVFMAYLKNFRVVAKVDMRKLFHMPAYRIFKKELDFVGATLDRLREQYRRNASADKYNMLALLIEAQKEDPENFSENDIRDHSITMVFAGFETTSIAMQWIWYLLDDQPGVVEKLRAEIAQHAPGGEPGYEAVAKMDYLTAVFKETMRIRPPLWITGRQPIETDRLGRYEVTPDTIIVMPQFAMHRHPRWWKEPDAFIPERFMPGQEEAAGLDPGLYFPFSPGPRKCSGFKLAEVEAKTIFATLLPHFTLKLPDKEKNAFDPGISLKLRKPLYAEIHRAG